MSFFGLFSWRGRGADRISVPQAGAVGEVPATPELSFIGLIEATVHHDFDRADEYIESLGVPHLIAGGALTLTELICSHIDRLDADERDEFISELCARAGHHDAHRPSHTVMLQLAELLAVVSSHPSHEGGATFSRISLPGMAALFDIFCQSTTTTHTDAVDHLRMKFMVTVAERGAE